MPFQHAALQTPYAAAYGALAVTILGVTYFVPSAARLAGLSLALIDLPITFFVLYRVGVPTGPRPEQRAHRSTWWATNRECCNPRV